MNHTLKFGLLKDSKDDRDIVCCFQYEKIDLPSKFSLQDKVKLILIMDAH